VPPLGMFGGDIFRVQMEIESARRTAAQNGESVGSNATPGAEMASGITAELLAEARRSLALSQAQYGVFSQLGMIPAMATGGKVLSGGWALVGEQGPELARLPSGSQVYPNSESRSMMEPQPVNVRVFIGNQELTDIVRVETDDRLTKLASRATPRGGVAGRKAGR
jgi:hypothetical protein